MKHIFATTLIFALAQACFGKPSLSIDTQFQNFKTTHKKHYNNPLEEAYRKGVFAANLATINRHNEEYDAGEHKWTMGVNHLSDLTHEEFMELNKLKVPDLPQRETKYKMQAKIVADAIDWRDQGYITHVKDQGQCGSCWAFGAIASLEAAHVEAGGDLIAMSEQQVLDCDTTDGGCNGGWYDTAWQYIQGEGGVDTEAAYPYIARKHLTCQAESNGPFVATVTGCEGGPNTFCDNSGHKDGNEANLVTALNDRPISVAVDATPFQSYSGGILDTCHRFYRLNHAVFAVGYGSDAGGDYFIIKNSWGASWGEDGYIRLA